MPFIKLNKKTMRFTAIDFMTGKTLFVDLKQIPKSYGRKVIIYSGNGNNIHFTHWKDSWFE